MICTKSYNNFHMVQSYLLDYLFHCRKLTHKEVNKTLRLLSLLCPWRDLSTQQSAYKQSLECQDRLDHVRAPRIYSQELLSQLRFYSDTSFWCLTLIWREEEGRPSRCSYWGCWTALGRLHVPGSWGQTGCQAAQLPSPLRVSLRALAGGSSS